MTDTVSTKKRKVIMSRVRGKDTKPEMAVRRWLHAHGFRFRLHRRDLPGSPDIVLPKYRTVIFVNGCFWHRHRGCPRTTTPKTHKDFWEKKFQANISRDIANEDRLRCLGWRVLIVWECRTKRDEDIEDALNDLIASKNSIDSDI
ncbi:DNA mismatch endonuclease Vsr [Dethiosulfovibrio peptidovorans]|uniref:very short patch repair endonuclease n=1 Tax=Dethiosulfovibrio peptidovorans TaxID=47055 RepID=UPI00019E58CC